MKLTSAVTCGCLLLATIAAPCLRAQSSATEGWENTAGGKMSFDVTSVKQNTAGLPPSGPTPRSNFPLGPGDVYHGTGGVFSASNYPASIYIAFAYKLTNNDANALFSELPKWARNERFDIEAHGPINATKDQMRLMMQSLLRDRFKFAMHREVRSLPVYALAFAKLGKMGPQLRLYGKNEVACPVGKVSPLAVIDKEFPLACGGVQVLTPSEPDLFRIGARNIGTALFATYLTGPATGVDRPVLDKTGIVGTVDFVLEFAPDIPNALSGAAGPTFLEALKDQLGLKLDAETAPVNTLVVDHIEEPSPN